MAFPSAELEPRPDTFLATHAPQTGGEESVTTDIDFATLLAVTRRSLVWIVLLLILSLAGSQIFIRYTRPLYQSRSTIKIDEASQANVLGLGFGTEEKPGGRGATRLGGEVELIKSEVLYTQLKDSLDLRVSYFAEGTMLESELYHSSPFAIATELLDPSLYNQPFNVVLLDSQRVSLQYNLKGETIAGEYRLGQPIKAPGVVLTMRLNRNFTPEATDQNYHFTVNSDAQLTQYLNGNLNVQVLNPDAGTISIAFTDHSPVKAHDIVAKITELYRGAKLRKTSQSAAQTLAFLDGQIEATGDSLDHVEREMQRFVTSAKGYDTRGRFMENQVKLVELQERRTVDQKRLNQLNQMQRLVDSQSDLTDMIISLTSPEDMAIRAQLESLAQMALSHKVKELTYKEPTTVMRREEIEYNFGRRQVSTFIEQERRKLSEELASIDRKTGELASQVAGLPAQETERARLQRQLDLYNKFVGSLMDKKVSYQISKAGTTPDFQVLANPSTPGSPIYPEKFIVYLIGLAIGIVMSLGLVAGRYFSHNTVTNLRELETHAQATVLGVIPTYTKEKMLISRMVIDKNPKSAISESIRSIRTNLEFLGNTKQKHRLITVTSTISGEGKTFVAVNMGGIMAQTGQRVAILDMDMRKPKVHLAFDLENTKGMSTLLIDKHTIDDCVHKTTIDTLDVISAGPTPPNPSELILSPRFDEILTELRQRYDVVIIDTPPVGLVTDGMLIMRKADIPIYIVRADYSRKVFLKNVNKLIRVNGLTNLCTILNDSQSSGLYGYGYGYGYSYGYGYGYGTGSGYGYYEEVESKAPTGLFAGLRSRLSGMGGASSLGQGADDDDDDE